MLALPTKLTKSFSTGKLLRIFALESNGREERLIKCGNAFSHVNRKDPDRPYLYYDLAEDANLLLKGSPFSYRDGFSHVSWYPPPEVIPTRVASLSTETTPKAIETEDGSWECGTIGSAKTMDA